MQCKLIDIVKVKVLGGYRLYLEFNDGTRGEIDISRLILFQGVFEPLKEESFFSKVFLNSEIGTISWENGADLSPAYLRENIELKLF